MPPEKVTTSARMGAEGGDPIARALAISDSALPSISSCSASAMPVQTVQSVSGLAGWPTSMFSPRIPARTRRAGGEIQAMRAVPGSIRTRRPPTWAQTVASTSPATKRAVGRAAADVQVQDPQVLLFGKQGGAAAPAGEDGLELRPRRGHHEPAGILGKLLHDGPGVLPLSGFAGDDHRAGVDASPGQIRLPELLPDPGENGVAVKAGLVQKRREDDGAAVEHLAVDDLHRCHGVDTTQAGRGQPADDQTRGRGADVDSDAGQGIAQ